MLKIQETGKRGGIFNVKPGTSAPLNISAADIRKIGEKKGTWSKTITLSATKNNGQRLGYYFEINVETSSFDVNKKLPVLLLENDVEIEGHFFMQLTKINKKKDRVVSYEVVVKDDVSDFFTIINGRYLTDLDFSEENHFLTAANIVATFPNTSANSNYKYHLTANADDVFDVSQFKPAIWLRKYWDRIHARAGKAYEWASMNDPDTKFDNLIVPCNVDKPAGDTNPFVAASETVWSRTSTPNPGVPAAITLQDLAPSTEIFDPLNCYNPIFGRYTSPLVVSAGASIIYNIKAKMTLKIKNNTANTIKLTGGTNSPYYAARTGVKKNGTAITYGFVVPPSFANTLPMGTLIAGSGEHVLFDGNVDYNIEVTGFGVGDWLLLSNSLIASYNTATWKDNVSLVDASVSHEWVMSGIEMTIVNNGGNGYGYGELIQINKFIPQKIKQSEIVAAVMTLNNLIVDREKSTPNKIVYTKRDAYLDSGVVKDWDKSRKLDKGQEHEITFLPDLTAKRKVLTYKEDKDVANVGYTGNTQEIYGQVEYTFKSEFANDVEKTEIVFSPTPMQGTSFGAVVPMYSGKAPGCNIRLLYSGGIKPCAAYTINNFPGNGLTITSGYPYVGHFDDPITPKLDINFGLCDFYFYDKLKTFTNRNMFNLNWRRTFNQIDNGRMLTGWFNLDEYDVKTLRLNDKIFVENEYWNINKVIDYDANNKGLTKVELISVDDLLKIPTKTKSPGVIGNGTVIANPIRGTIAKVNAGLNTIAGFGQVQILGKGNFVGSGVKNAIVVGDDQTVEEDGVYTPMLKVTGENPAEFCESGIKVSAIYDCGSGVLMVGNFDFNNVPTVNGVPISVGGSATWGSITGTLSAQLDLQAALNAKQPLSPILTALAALSATGGILIQTEGSSFVKRSLIAPSSGMTITNADGVAGNPTFMFANDLAALEALAGTGFSVRSATDTWVQRTITGTAGQINVTNGNGVSGNPVISIDPAIISGLGLWVTGSSGTGSIRPASGGNDATANFATALSGQNNSVEGVNGAASGLWNRVTSAASSAFAGGLSTSSTARNVVSANSGFSWQRVNTVGSFGVASSDAAILGGLNNTITAGAPQAVILGGFTNAATAQFAAVLGGTLGNAGATGSVVLGGSGGTTNPNATNSATVGGTGNGTAGVSANGVILGGSDNQIRRNSEIGFGHNGLAGQSGFWTCSAVTTNDTITDLFGGATDRFIISNGESYHCEITVVGRRSTGTNISWRMNCLIKNVSTTVTGIFSTATMMSDLGGAPVLTVTADNTNKCLRIQVKGLAGATINWFAKVDYTMVK